MTISYIVAFLYNNIFVQAIKKRKDHHFDTTNYMRIYCHSTVGYIALLLLPPFWNAFPPGSFRSSSKTQCPGILTHNAPLELYQYSYLFLKPKSAVVHILACFERTIDVNVRANVLSVISIKLEENIYGG